MNFMRGRLEEIERDYQDRLELIRSGSEHPMPLYAKLVHNHAAMGMPKKHIAKILGISVAVMERYYEDDLELGIAQINFKIASNVAGKALSDDPDAAKIGLDWLDRRGGDGWRKSTQKIEVEDTKPPIIDSSKLTARGTRTTGSDCDAPQGNRGRRGSQRRMIGADLARIDARAQLIDIGRVEWKNLFIFS